MMHGSRDLLVGAAVRGKAAGRPYRNPRRSAAPGRVPLVVSGAHFQQLKDMVRRCNCGLRQMLFITLGFVLSEKGGGSSPGSLPGLDPLRLMDLSADSLDRENEPPRLLRLADTRTGGGAFLYSRRSAPQRDGLPVLVPAHAPVDQPAFDLVARAIEFDQCLLLEFFFEPSVLPVHNAGRMLLAYGAGLERLIRAVA